MEIHNPLGIEIRDIGETQYHGVPVRVVSGTRRYATQVEDLWTAITTPERLARWFLPVSGDLQPGGRFQLEGHAGGDIEQCDPPHTLAVTWESGESVSWVRVVLRPVGDEAELTLSHYVDKSENSEKFWQQYGPGATGVGWELTFVGLALHVADPDVALDAQAFQAWTLSDAGKAFVRSVASAWGDADIAGGESEAQALSAAATTAKFYTGE